MNDAAGGAAETHTTARNDAGSKAEDTKTKESANEKKNDGKDGKDQAGDGGGDTIGNLLMLVGGGFIGYGLYYLLDFPEPCQVAMEAAARSPLVQARVGLPISHKWWWSGNVNQYVASVRIPISGDKGKAELHARVMYRPGNARTHATQRTRASFLSFVRDKEGKGKEKC